MELCKLNQYLRCTEPMNIRLPSKVISQQNLSYNLMQILLLERTKLLSPLVIVARKYKFLDLTARFIESLLAKI
jgi:hypothetical protein